MWPHRQQPTRLHCPWDSPGKNTGVGCHFFPQCMKLKSEVTQSCPTLRDPWTAAHQVPLSMGFSRQEYWSGLPSVSNSSVSFSLGFKLFKPSSLSKKKKKMKLNILRSACLSLPAYSCLCTIIISEFWEVCLRVAQYLYFSWVWELLCTCIYVLFVWFFPQLYWDIIDM